MAQTVGHIAPKPDPESEPDPQLDQDQGQDSGCNSDPEQDLWLPPRRMRRYHLNKILAAVLFCVLFAGWMYFQWADPILRLLPMGLALITVLVTGVTVIGEINRSRGRQITLEIGHSEKGTPVLEVLTPEDKRRFELASVKRMVWQDGPDVIEEGDEPDTRGLWLFDSTQQVLAHIDENLLADEEEARDFIGWLRRRTKLPCKVEWPTVQ